MCELEQFITTDSIEKILVNIYKQYYVSTYEIN